MADEIIKAAKEGCLATLEVVSNMDDSEAAHGMADDAILAFLRDIGHSDVTNAWQAAADKVGFWYS